MKLLSWNLAGRAKQAARQIALIGSRQADIVALQEVTLRTRALLGPALAELALFHQIDTFDLYPLHAARRGPRKNGLLIASRLPIQNLGENRSLKWPERLLSVAANTTLGAVEIHTAHVPPGSSNGWIKIETFDGIFKLLATPSARPRILCGDFNSPREERRNGEVITWGQRITRSGEVVFRRTIRGGDGRQWDAAERAVIVGLKSHNLSDAFPSVDI